MGDRTSVILTVLEAHKDRANDLFPFPCDEDHQDTDGQWSFYFNEVNYGELGFLALLEKAGIPYDSNWKDGPEFTEGTEHGRFTETGEFLRKEIYDSSYSIPLDTLMEYIDQPDALRRRILAHKDNLEVIPWDNQLEYSKLYLATQLIAPD